MASALIIEDNPDLAALYQMTLEEEGVEVLGIYDDPRVAIDALECDPGLILLDERLSGLSGTAFLPDLRKRFQTAKILVATADPDVAEAALELGADAARRKPFTLEELAQHIRELIAAG